MGSYVPNTKEQRQEMLKEIGFQTIDDLFAHIPAEVKITDHGLIFKDRLQDSLANLCLIRSICS